MEIQVGPEQKTYSVSEITKSIRNRLESEFGSVWVMGEISNFTHHSSGHMYFSLKDAGASLSGVMFKRDNAKIRFRPEPGVKVICHGTISVYPPRGSYQLIVDLMEPKGLGDLQLAFDQLKKKLISEGLFDESRKQETPFLPKRIGIITSPTGAVIRDMMNVLNRRFEDAHLILAPVKVQGDGAKESIVQAIEDFNRLSGVDVLILARGGGSLEDLWAFNEEVVARAIAASDIPIISAVGHEVDYTIADFVSDLRAPTPSAAAELVLPQKLDLQERIWNFRRRFDLALMSQVDVYRERLQKLTNSRVLQNPQILLDDARQRTDDLTRSLSKSLSTWLELRKENLKTVSGKMQALSPLACLDRGYSIVFDGARRNVIKSTSELDQNGRVWVRLAKGSFKGKVEEIDSSNNG